MSICHIWPEKLQTWHVTPLATGMLEEAALTAQRGGSKRFVTYQRSERTKAVTSRMGLLSPQKEKCKKQPTIYILPLLRKGREELFLFGECIAIQAANNTQ